MAKKIAAVPIPDDVGEYWPECTACSLHKSVASVCMEGDGPENAPILILGEAPGAMEDELNRPFVGQAGDYLRETIIVHAGIPESMYRLTYSSRCRPPQNRTPKVSELQKCRRYLVAEINRIRPKVIVAVGNASLATILRTFYSGAQEEGVSKSVEGRISGISKWQGKPFWTPEFSCWVVPTYHPSYCMRNLRGGSYYTTELVINDFKTAKRLAEAPLPVYVTPRSIFVDSADMAGAVIDQMSATKSFAFDIETGGAGRSIDKWVIGMSFCASEKCGYYIPFNVIESDPIVYKKFLRLMASPNHTKVMHNGAYEFRILTFNKKPIHGTYFDTMVAAHLLDENFSKRLKDLTWLNTCFGGYDFELEKYKSENKIKEDYSKIPQELLAPYGALDAVATWILYKKMKPALVSEGLLPLYQKIVMPVRRVMSNAEVTGIRVDLERAKVLSDACETATKKLTELIFSVAGGTFNLNSGQQLADVLYRKMGFIPLKKTKTGVSVDAESIAYVATQPNSEIAAHLVSLSFVRTMHKTHITQAVESVWPEDGRVHASYNITGAVTGRASCSFPSLQNVPQDRLVRSLYIASPGCQLVEADLRSAEIAMVAAVSGEETFLRAFRDGLDIHSETFRKMYGLPSDYECSEVERRMAKTVNFGLVYGLTSLGLAKRLGISVEEASSFIDSYFDTLPNVHKWLERQKAIVRSKGVVVSIFGRKRRLPSGTSDMFVEVNRAERQAMNSPIQSGAADYTYIGLVRLERLMERAHLDSKIVHTVHDCAIVDTVYSEIDAVSGMVREAFETPVKVVRIGMQVEIKVSPRWGEHNKSKLDGIFTQLGISV